jgi:flagellar basal-body rod protein FlgB
MAISDLSIFSVLRTKMHWHQERQRLLAENVANADTPLFRPRDLVPPKFETRAASATNVALALTSPSHIAGSAAGHGQFQLERSSGLETRPAGNAVNLEDEMLKVAANQMDYQAATTLYGRSLGLLKTALGRR